MAGIHDDGTNTTGTTPRAALSQILDTLGWNQISASHVTIDGADPVLPTNYMVGTAGAAAIAATGLAAVDLWELKTGQRQDAGIDVRTGAIAMRCSRYTRIVGETTPATWKEISGFYQAKDGRWIQLHCNFPHHRDGVVKLLGCDVDRDQVKAAVAAWDSFALEDALTEAGMVASVSRTHTEWSEHPHSSHVDSKPLMEITKIGDSDPEPLPKGGRPLSGIRALDLTRVLAGPTCGRTLAEHGADVMRISGPHLPFHEQLVMDTGHGKLAAHVDLRNDKGRETLRGLVTTGDIFTQGYRPGTLDSRGFSPEALAELRPGIIYVTLSAYGPDGPWGGKRGFDTLVQGATGITVEQGRDGPPSHLPVSLLDYATGYLMAFGAMVALGRRAREGGSYHVRLSLVQTAHWLKKLGRVPASANAFDMPDPGFDDVTDLMMESDTPFGRLAHLAPLITLSETKPYWARPVVPLGTHEPVWP